MQATKERLGFRAVAALASAALVLSLGASYVAFADEADDDATTYDVSAVQSDGTTESMANDYLDATATAVANDDASTTWLIPAEDVETGTYVDFYYGYTITAAGYTLTHPFQLLIGEQNDDGTYAYEIYYNGEQTDRYDAYFGESVTVTEDGVYLTTYAVDGLSDITVSYDAVTETATAESEETSEVVSTTWTIPAEDVATGSTVDFYYGYTITARGLSMAHGFQLVIGEQNEDGTYAYEIYYNGVQNDTWDSYFGDSVTVTDEGVELVTYPVDGLSDITVSYDVVTETTTVDSTTVNTETTTESYAITFSFTEAGAALITTVSYNGEELTANEDGSYSITVESIDELIPVSMYVSMMGNTATAYISVTETDGVYTVSFVQSDGETASMMAGYIDSSSVTADTITETVSTTYVITAESIDDLVDFTYTYYVASMDWTHSVDFQMELTEVSDGVYSFELYYKGEQTDSYDDFFADTVTVTANDDGTYSIAITCYPISGAELVGVTYTVTTTTTTEADSEETSEVVSTTWTIPAEDVATGSTVDFYYGYTISAMGRSMAHGFQLVIGEQNEDGTYAYEIYYNGVQNDTWDSYFGDSVTVTEDGVELVTYPVDGLSAITVSYDVIETYVAECTVNDDNTYTLTFSFTDEGDELITSVSYDGEELTANEDGSYSITVASVAEGDLFPIDLVIDVDEMTGTFTTYLLIGSLTSDDVDDDATDDESDDSDSDDDATDDESDDSDDDATDDDSDDDATDEESDDSDDSDDESDSSGSGSQQQGQGGQQSGGQQSGGQQSGDSSQGGSMAQTGDSTMNMALVAAIAAIAAIALCGVALVARRRQA